MVELLFHLSEDLASDESFMGAEGTWMAGDADAVLSDRGWEEFCFGSGESSEKEEDATRIFLGNESDHIIGKFRPEFHMASRVSLFDA